MAFSFTTVSCSSATCGRIGSGLIPGNSGFTSWRMATYWIPCLSKMPARTPRPEPYMESIANLKVALRMRSKIRKLAHGFDICGLQIDFFDFCVVALRALRCGSSSPSIIFMMAGVAEPPNLALNFTPFQFHGLWLDVTMTPPAAPSFFTLKETAGVGT